MMMAFGSVSTLNMLVWTYYWEFDARAVSIILSAPSLLAVVLVVFTLGPLGRGASRSTSLLQLSVVGLILNCLWLYPLRMLELLPAERAQPGVLAELPVHADVHVLLPDARDPDAVDHRRHH
jgi:GPH family glycoside/pentoside/hexuronide:cation symporter